jgi:hypothetical protein
VPAQMAFQISAGGARRSVEYVSDLQPNDIPGSTCPRTSSWDFPLKEDFSRSGNVEVSAK